MDKNRKAEKIIKSLILIILVIIILLIVLLISINFSKGSNDKQNTIDVNQVDSNNEDKPDPPMYEEYSTSNKLESLSDIEEYFIIKNIIFNYNRYRKNLNITEKDLDTHALKVTEEEKQKYIDEELKIQKNIAKEALYSNLSKEYIKEYSISKDNINQKLGIENSINNLIIDEIYVAKNTNSISTYFVSGFNISTENIDTFEVIIVLDTHNGAFSIYPDEYLKKHNYSNLKTGYELQISTDSIENKTYNGFEYKQIEEADIAKEYFNNYKYRMIYNLNNTYEKLDEEYSKKRFGNKQNFIDYIEENKEFIISSYVSKYSIISNINTKEYRFIDTNDNIYMFRVYGGITDYKVFLDDYTIETANNVSEYNSYKERGKHTYNINKFIKMVNTRDYNAIYNVLDSTFKANNFSDVSSLKEYIKNNFYNYNYIELDTYEEKEGYNVYKYKLKNMENEEESKRLEIAIKLGPDMNFTISFNVKQE